MSNSNNKQYIRYAIIDDAQFEKYIGKTIDGVHFIIGEDGVYLEVADIVRILPECASMFYPSQSGDYVAGQVGWYQVKHTDNGLRSSKAHGRSTFVSVAFIQGLMMSTHSKLNRAEYKDTALVLTALEEAAQMHIDQNGPRDQIIAIPKNQWIAHNNQYKHSAHKTSTTPRKKKTNNAIKAPKSVGGCKPFIDVAALPDNVVKAPDDFKTFIDMLCKAVLDHCEVTITLKTKD